MSTILGFTGLMVLCCLPAALSTLGMLWYRYGHDPRRGSVREVAAGPWLAAQIARQGLDVRLEVHGAPGLDAYWPGVDRIGLSSPTWHGRRPNHLAIAAHELGHALNIRSHRLMAHVLPIARLAQGLSWRSFVATVFAAGLVGAPALLPVATTLLVTSLVVTGIVCLDEWLASTHAARMLRADPTVTAADRSVARSSMRSAGAIYGLDLFGQSVVLGIWPWAVSAWPTATGAALGPPGPEAIGFALVLLPVLVLRAAQVGLQVWDPEPVTTDFRLFTVMHRESRWEFLTAVAVLALVVLLHPLLTGPLGTSALVGAIVTAIGPVGALVRALVLVPTVLLLQRLSAPVPDEPPMLLSSGGLDGAAPALLALYTDPPWYLRVSWLASLAYLPLLGVLAIRLCT